MTSHRFVWPLALLLFHGCSDTGGRPGWKPEPDELDERLCPTCVRAGGETGSFEAPAADRSPCEDERREPIAEDDDVLGLTPASVRPLLDREVEISVRWRDIGDRPIPGLEDAPLTLRVQTGDAFRVVSTPIDGAPAGTECRDRLEIEAEVTLSGSLTGRFEAVRIEPDSHEYAHGWGKADLSTFLGSLPLDFDPERGAHMAVMDAGFTFYPGGIRGHLEVWRFYQHEQEPERWLAGGVPLWGGFPADPCQTDERPIEPTETVGERPFAEVIDAVRARIAGQNPIAADWDGSPVELSFEPGETRDHCVSLRADAHSYVGSATADELFAAGLTADVDVRSSDQRLSTQRAMDVEFYFDRSGELADHVWLSLRGDMVPVEEFEDRFGLAGVDLQDSRCAGLWIQSFYGRNEQGDFADGQLEVAGSACREREDPEIEDPSPLTGFEYAEWCTQGTCTQPPRRRW